ncbi:MAG: hypothetical protein ACOXZR_02005 [Bacilli bacterium]|jgi:hypothetical protein
MKEKIFLTSFFIMSLSVVIFFTVQLDKQIDDTVINIIDDKVIKYLENDLDTLNDLDFSYFYLLFDEHLLNSKDFVSLFVFFEKNNYEYKIEEITPYINPLYQDLLTSVNVIDVKEKKLNKIIISFYDEYTKALTMNNLEEEINKCFINGINIKMIKINTSKKGLKNFLTTYSKIKYSFTKEGIFRKMGNI